MSTQVTYSKSRKRVAAVIAVLLTGAILAGGTFAWQSLNQQARNNAKGENGPAGGRLHDDYEVMGDDFGKEEWAANLTANKDIYVENFETEANNGRDIFVRVRLYEYMEIGAGAHEEPPISDGSTPTPTPNAAYDDRDAESLIASANRNDVTTWSPRVPGTDAASDLFRSYWNWTMGGQKNYMPTFNKDNHSKETDIKGDAVDPGALDTGEVMNTTKSGGTKAYSSNAGLHDYFDTNTTYRAQEKYWDPDLGTAGEHAITTNDVEHTAKATKTATVITMDEWMSASYNSQKGDYWVMDADGWCYWANPIAPETATGLLLNNITFQKDPEREWYYSIYVKSQMATAEDWKSTADGMGFYADPDEEPSDEAADLLTIITAPDPEVRSISLDPAAAIAVNGSLTLTPQVTVTNTNDPTWQEVIWEIAPSDLTRAAGVAGTFADGVFTPVAADAEKWFTIKATSVKDTTISASSEVYVPAATQSVKTSANGDTTLYYIDHGDNTYQKVNANHTFGNLICPQTEGEPGAADDRTNVIEIGGVHYLDEGDGKYYIRAGSDGKLGVAPDERVYEKEGSMVLADTAVRLTITPDSQVVGPGATMGFTASATLDGDVMDVSQVTWALEGDYAPDTTITSPGETATLSVAANETSAFVKIVAAYTGDYGTTAEAAIVVGNGPAAGVIDGGTFTDDNGVQWLVAKDDGNGHKLIITKYVFGFKDGIGTEGTPYNKSTLFTQLDSGNNDLKTALIDFYENKAGDSIRAAAVAYQPLTDVYTEPTADYLTTGEAGYSKPGSTAASSDGRDAIFTLSVTELLGYLNVEERIGYDVLNNAKTRLWWLRSPGSPSSKATNVITTGDPFNEGPHIVNRGFRPCLWIVD